MIAAPTGNELSAPEPKAGPGVRRRLSVVAACVGVGLLLLGFVLWLVPTGILPAELDFRLHPVTYSGIVDAVKKQGLAPGTSGDFVMDRGWNPSTLRARMPQERRFRGQGAGRVWASRNADGNYQIAIMVLDLGHAGTFGYLYTEVEPDIVVEPFREFRGVPGPMGQPDHKLNHNWWSIYSNLE